MITWCYCYVIAVTVTTVENNVLNARNACGKKCMFLSDCFCMLIKAYNGLLVVKKLDTPVLI